MQLQSSLIARNAFGAAGAIVNSTDAFTSISDSTIVQNTALPGSASQPAALGEVS